MYCSVIKLKDLSICTAIHLVLLASEKLYGWSYEGKVTHVRHLAGPMVWDRSYLVLSPVSGQPLESEVQWRGILNRL